MGKKYLLMIFGILVILIAGIFAVVYFYSEKSEERITTPSKIEEAIIPVSPPPIKKVKAAEGCHPVEVQSGVKPGIEGVGEVIVEEAVRKISELCQEYKDFETTITCEKAADIVLAKYPGNIFSIKKAQIDIPLPPGEGKTSELIDVWSVSVNLEESADRLEVMVDTTTGKIKILKPI